MQPPPSPIPMPLPCRACPESRPPILRQLRQLRKLSGRESGFTLAEIAVALGIFSFALVSMMGMLSVGLKNSRKATVQTAASNLLTGIVADIHASTPLALGDDKFSYTSPKLQLEATLNKKTNTVTAAPGALSLNESCSVVSQNAPEMLQKVYSVQFFPGTDGVAAIRVRVEWPSNRQPNTKPEGFLEALVPLPL